jgi:hypothetical protein
VVQYFFNGSQALSFSEAFLWTVIGSCAMVNVWMEYRRKKMPPKEPKTGWPARIQRVAQITAVFFFIACLRYSREINWYRLENRLMPGLHLKPTLPTGASKE